MAITEEKIKKWQEKKKVKRLIKALGDERLGVRKFAAEALGEIGDSRAVEPLINSLQDKNEDVRKYTARALNSLNWQVPSNEQGAYYYIDRGEFEKCVKMGVIAVEPLIKALGDESLGVRKYAAEALGEIADPRAVEPLIKALGDEDWLVRSQAAFALNSIKNTGISDTDKQKILNLGKICIKKHKDRDYGIGCGHDDYPPEYIEFN